MSFSNTEMNNILIEKTKAKDLTDAQKKDIWQSNFTEEEILNGYYKAYQSLKEQCKPVEDANEKIEAFKRDYKYDYPLLVRQNLFEEFVADCGKFGVFDRDFIVGMTTLKVTTLVDTGEPPISQVSGESGVGKTFGKTVLGYGFGWVPYIDENGVRYYPSISNMGGTPAVAIYSNDPEDKADGMIMDFDDQRNVSNTTTQIFLQSTNAPFMERPTYKSVVNLEKQTFYFARNQRFILTAVHLPKELLDAGMNTRTLKVNVTKQDERELQKYSFSSGNLQERLKNFCNKWSCFWTNLYDAVYFKGKRSYLEVPEKYKNVEVFLDLGSSRSYQHVKAIAAVYALFRDPMAVIEGRPLVATENEVERAAAFVRAHVLRSMEDDETSALNGDWIEGDVTTEIAEEIMRDSQSSYSYNELLTKVMAKLTERGVHNVKRTASRFVTKFFKNECHEEKGLYYVIRKSE